MPFKVSQIPQGPGKLQQAKNRRTHENQTGKKEAIFFTLEEQTNQPNRKQLKTHIF